MAKHPVFIAGFTVDPARYGEPLDEHVIVEFLAMRTQDEGLQNFVVWPAEKLPLPHEVLEIITGEETEKTESPPELDAFRDPMVALRAISARFDGVYDHPDLLKLGPLADRAKDIRDIANAGLAASAKKIAKLEAEAGAALAALKGIEAYARSQVERLETHYEPAALPATPHPRWKAVIDALDAGAPTNRSKEA
jgi:hypothetical protein